MEGVVGNHGLGLNIEFLMLFSISNALSIVIYDWQQCFQH